MPRRSVAADMTFLASDDAAFVNGETIACDGEVSRPSSGDRTPRS